MLSQCGPISTLVDETRGLNDTPRFCNQSICICILSSRLTSPLPPSPLFKSSADANFASLFALFCRPLLASISDQQSPLNAVTDELTLSTSDFPTLAAAVATPPPTLAELASQVSDPSETHDISVSAKAQEKAERRAAKLAAATERAAERQRITQEKAAVKAAEKAEKLRIAQEKAIEQEKLDVIKAEQQKLEKIQREKERAVKEERAMVSRQEKQREAKAERERGNEKVAEAATKKTPPNQAHKARTPRPTNSPVTPIVPIEPPAQVALLSKKPKKNKPVARPIRVPKDDDMTSVKDNDDHPVTPSVPTPVDNFHMASSTPSSSNRSSRAHSLERNASTSLSEMLNTLHAMNPSMNLPNHPIFDVHKINPAAKMPLEYAPLVHALSALSMGGGSFANNVPSGSIDNAVSSFQQLLETLTQTISDLLRLLPRTTWDDSSSFDGVLRDMLKGDDFLDDSGDADTDEEVLDADNAPGPSATGKEDEVAALTLALERRARWMEVQLSKLEELHRDINTAAVKAILAFNDNGWDRHNFMPHIGKTLRRFETLGLTEDEDDSGHLRPMTADELEEKLAVAKEAAVFAETEVREMMERMTTFKPLDDDF